MTREEAIKTISKMLAVTDLTVRGNMTVKMVEACRMAIKVLEQEQYYKDLANSYEKTINKLTKAISEQEPKTEWIPVSERLPEDRREVLVTAYWHETYQVMMASYFGDGLWWCVPFNNCGEHMQKLNPKAWKELPKPYKESEG